MVSESNERDDLHSSIVPADKIEQRILLIRGEKVILDVDLAALYGVTTKQLNQQVKRNQNRFPPDFMFKLLPEEKKEVVTNCDLLGNVKYSNVLPYAFTEHGAIMAASVLNTPRAAATRQRARHSQESRPTAWWPTMERSSRSSHGI